VFAIIQVAANHCDRLSLWISRVILIDMCARNIPLWSPHSCGVRCAAVHLQRGAATSSTTTDPSTGSQFVATVQSYIMNALAGIFVLGAPQVKLGRLRALWNIDHSARQGHHTFVSIVARASILQTASPDISKEDTETNHKRSDYCGRAYYFVSPLNVCYRAYMSRLQVLDVKPRFIGYFDD
jgi:hypothetical protein